MSNSANARTWRTCSALFPTGCRGPQPWVTFYMQWVIRGLSPPAVRVFPASCFRPRFSGVGTLSISRSKLAMASEIQGSTLPLAKSSSRRLDRCRNRVAIQLPNPTPGSLSQHGPGDRPRPPAQTSAAMTRHSQIDHLRDEHILNGFTWSPPA